jgi:AcrR family transcriptional regulator
VPRAKQRTPQLREHVLQVALTVLSRDGAAELTTRRVAQAAGTSVPAVYELFGDKAGLVRELAGEGFRLLHGQLMQVAGTEDPRADVAAVAAGFRSFACANPSLALLMFSRRLAEFAPVAADVSAAADLRGLLVGLLRRCRDAGLIEGDPVDLAHILLALAQGLALQEAAGWLGATDTARDRRWELAVRAFLDGLARR